MVKRLTLLLCLLAGGAGATVVTTAGSGNMTALAYNANDTLIIANGHTVTVDSTFSTTVPIWRMVFVRSGGTLAWSAGKGFMCNALVQGNRASSPFSSTNGGRLTGIIQGYLYTKHDAAFTYDWEVGAGADVLISVNAGINGANAFAVYGTNGPCRMYVLATADSIQISGARFSQYYNSSLANGGVQINASGRTGFTQIRRSYFDTSNFAYVTATGLRLDTCYFWVSAANIGRAVHLWNGASDTIIGCQINVDANGGAQGATGIYVSSCNGVLLRANYIRDYNSTSFGNSYGILLDGTTANTQIRCDTLTGFGFTIATAVGTANRAVTIDSCWLYGNSDTHELIIKHDGDRAWRIAANTMFFHSGGGRSAVLNYCSTTPSDSCDYLYNTINATYGGAAASSAIAWEHTASGSLTYLGDRVVGNILIGDNTGFGRAEIIVGTTAAQTATLTLREFKYNAYDSVYVTSGSTVNYPYTYSDSNKNNATAFDFVDSLNGDVRLNSTSPMINCGDSTFAVSAFGSAQASKAPFDIGYYQSYTTGTCGGSPTPTGACCISYTCYTGYTSAQCSTQGGTYQGDGTTTCVSCTNPGGGVGTGYGKRAWATFATLNYGDASYNLPSLAPFVARNFDLSVNINGVFEDSVTTLDAGFGKLTYITLSSYILTSTDTADLRAFCTARGYIFDSCFIWANGSTACINAIAPNGTPCTDVGGNMCSTHGNKIAFCGWNTYRLTPNFRYVGAQQFAIYKTLRDANNKGVMQDEACYVWQDTLTHSGSNSPWFPYPGYWTTGSAANTNAWTGSGLTNTQIADSMIRLKRSGWLSELVDSLTAHSQQIYSNGAAYGRMGSDLAGDVATLGAGMLFGEGMDINLTKGAGHFYSSMAWTLMDSLRVGGREWQSGNAIIWTNINVAETLSMTAIDGALGMKRRLAQERYTWYLMAGTPLRSFLFISLNWGGLGHQNGWSQTTDSLFKFCPSMDANLGAPSGARSVLSTGTGGTVYQRSFANGKVLWRDGSGGSYTAANAITVSLGATYYPVNYDGSYGAPTSTASIRNGEGLIFLTSTATSTGNASIDDVSVTEGGDMTFTVTLSAAQSVVTTLSYSTSNGTATGSTSCSGSTDYVSTIGGKSIPIGATSTTITIPTCNRASCQASRNFTVTFNVTSPATITVTDPTGTGTILDDDCGTTYGKTYKGKIVIKGKVKP